MLALALLRGCVQPSLNASRSRRADLRPLRGQPASRAPPAGAARPHRPPSRHDLAERRAQAGGRDARARDAVLALAGGPGQAALPLGEFIAKAIAPALGTRDLLVFDQRGTGELRPAELSARSSSSSAPARDRASCSNSARCRSAPRAAPTRPRNRSKTSRRSARPAATKSSSCTAPPTARRSRSSTPNATPSTSKRWCSTRSCRPTGRNRSRSRPSRRSAGARRAVLERRLRRHHVQPAGRHRDAWRRSCASTRSAAPSTTASGHRHTVHAGRGGLLGILRPAT